MAQLGSLSSFEAQNIGRPPFFDGNEYLYWKTRMKFFLQAENIKLWDIVNDGPFIPTKIENGLRIPKIKEEWSLDDERLLSLNSRAVHILFCALSRSEFNRVSMCETAREIWHTLEVTHEGTNQVKESKMSMLIHQYELFSMHHNESISDMYVRFGNIVNALKGLGRSYPNVELIRKILRCLPKEWQPKVTAIQEAKDLNVLPLEELIGSLLTYEMAMKDLNSKEEENSSRRKNLAFKARKEESSEEENSSGESEEDIALLTRQFHKFLKKKSFSKKRDQGKFNSRKKSSNIVCFECRKPGHYKTNCPLLKDNEKDERSDKKERRQKSMKKEKKALKAVWETDSEEESEDSQNESAKFCLMAIDDNEVPSSSHSHNNDDDDLDVGLSYDELVLCLERMCFKKKKLASKVKEFKSLVNELQIENESLRKELGECLHENDEFLNSRNEALDNEKKKIEDENNSLKEEIKGLKESLEKFTKGKEKLDNMLGAQKASNDRSGLGFTYGSEIPSGKTTFVKGKNLDEEHIPKPVFDNVASSSRIKSRNAHHAFMYRPRFVQKKNMHVSNNRHNFFRNAQSSQNAYRSHPMHVRPRFANAHAHSYSHPMHVHASRNVSNVPFRPKFQHRRNFRNNAPRFAYRDHFRQKVHFHKETYVCDFCGRLGHLENFCFDKMSHFHDLPKALGSRKVTNPQGPKSMWVPKMK